MPILGLNPYANYSSLIPVGWKIVPFCSIHGQSNAEGKSQYNELTIQDYIDNYVYDTYEPKVKIFSGANYGDNTYTSRGSWVKYRHGKNTGTIDGAFSFDASLMRELVNYYHSDIFLLKYAVGGSAITDRDYYLVGGNSWHPNQNQSLTAALSYLDWAYKNAYSNKIYLDYRYMFFSQGLAEASESGNIAYPGIKDEWGQAFNEVITEYKFQNRLLQQKYNYPNVLIKDFITIVPLIPESALYSSDVIAQQILNSDYYYETRNKGYTLRDSSHWSADSEIQIGLGLANDIIIPNNL